MNMAVQVSVWCTDAASFRSLSKREQMGHMGVLASVFFCFLLFLFQDRVSLLVSPETYSADQAALRLKDLSDSASQVL